MWQPCSCIMGLLSSALTTVCPCCSLFQPSHFGFFFSNLGEWSGYHFKYTYAWGKAQLKGYFFMFFFFFEEDLESCI